MGCDVCIQKIKSGTMFKEVHTQLVLYKLDNSKKGLQIVVIRNRNMMLIQLLLHSADGFFFFS